MHTNKGITMIALVITIIVLIILSAITIRVVNKDGLVEEALQARNQYGNLTSSTDNKMSQLKNEETTSSVNEKRLVDMYKLALEDRCDGTNCSKPTMHLHFGDYVDYRTDEDNNPRTVSPFILNQENTGLDYSASATSETTEIPYERMNWRVMGVDGNKLLLISENPSTTAFRIHGFLGYNNAINLLNSICKKMYSNYQLGAAARSINMDDVDNYLGGNAYDKTSFSNYGAEKEFSNIYHPDIWKSGPVWNGKIISNAYLYDPMTYHTNSKQPDIIIANGTDYYLASCSTGFDDGVALWFVDRVQLNKVYARGGICSSDGMESGRNVCI